MRLTIALEGNGEGKVLSSIDMREIVKMTITDDVEKSNFNPEMFKSCTDSAYECGYNQALEDVLNVVEWDGYTLDIKERIERLKK